MTGFSVGLEQSAAPQSSPTKLVPTKLCDHCQIYFEESLYIQALNLLTAILTSTDIEPLVAPPHFLALISTLSVHPAFTNRARNELDYQTSAHALNYLQIARHSVGSHSAQFGKAFTFGFERNGPGRDHDYASHESSKRSRRSGRGIRHLRADSDTEHDGQSSRFAGIANELARSGSLWSRASDFWHVIGWAFNCSLQHRIRWHDGWASWIEFMLSVLEDDYKEFQDRRRGIAADSTNRAEQSIIEHYVCGVGGDEGANGSRRFRERRIVCSIFADGSAKSISEFPEIWSNETKQVKLRKRSFGASNDVLDKYMDSDENQNEEREESHDAENDTKDDTSSRRFNSEISTHRQTLGVDARLSETSDYDTFDLRLRLLALIMDVMDGPSSDSSSRDRFTALVLDTVRYLPIGLFFGFVTAHTLHNLRSSFAINLASGIMRAIISSSAPDDNDAELDQNIMVECYLPWAANTSGPVENAKLSLCVEVLLQSLHSRGLLQINTTLSNAVSEGIKARNTSAYSKRNKDHGQSFAILERSSTRLRAILLLL